MDKLGLSILAVDDEAGILKALSRLLKDLDVEFLTASNGAEALSILKERPVSLIISDQRMPGMEGVEMLGKSRELSPDSIRILLTGYADIDATVDSINKGAVAYYINKPWDDDLLLSRIKESLNTFKLAIENRRLNKLTAAQNEKLKKLNDTLEQRVEEQTKEIQEKHRELIDSFMETIKAFSTIIEVRSQDMGSHSQRVAQMAKSFVRSYNLPEKELQDIVVAAFLHDIGKVAVPDKILEKSDHDLTNAERDTIAKHVIIGHSCVFGISGFEEVGLIIRHHHEDFDGQGYPDKLKGSGIPFGARVIRLADSFDHVAFAKGYPNARLINEAAAYLVKNSGSKFDPALVKKFIELDIGNMFLSQHSAETAVLRPQNLEEGMIVASDVYTNNGMFLLPKGAKLSPGMIKRLINIDKYDTIRKGVCVHIPSEKEAPNGALAHI